MITLITGVPGAGKTLYALNLVKALADKEPDRPVFYSGVADLTLPWSNLDLGIEVAPGVVAKGAEEWHKLPSKSIILIDECQRVFRPRGHGTQVPDCVAALETHRHKGVDIFIVTQHPMLMDTNVRRLVGQHFHVMRKFGMARAVVHEFNGCREQADKSRADSIRHDFTYPKESYGWYKSAEIHTHKRRIPARIYFLFLVPFLLIGCGYLFYQTMYGYVTGDALRSKVDKIEGKSSAASGSSQDPASHPTRSTQAVKLTPAQYVAQYQARLPDLPHTAPVYDDVTKPVKAPYPAACVASDTRCHCYTQQATRLHVSESMCRNIVERGYFVAWQEDKPLAAPEPRQRPAAAREELASQPPPEPPPLQNQPPATHYVQPRAVVVPSRVAVAPPTGASTTAPAQTVATHAESR